MRAPLLAVWLASMLGCLAIAPALADRKLEWGGGPPKYAVIEPEKSNLNIGSVVLVCEEAGSTRVPQLHIYLSTKGQLLPTGATPQQLKGDPRVEIEIDGEVFKVDLLFADIYVVLADETDRMFPRLSAGLIDAMAAGKIMVLRFDLLAEDVGQPAAFDGEAVITLRPDIGGASISAVRDCAITVARLK